MEFWTEIAIEKPRQLSIEKDDNCLIEDIYQIVQSKRVVVKLINDTSEKQARNKYR